MIPEEVAELGVLLRNELPDLEYTESINIAWKIYNLQQLYNKAKLEGSY